MRRLISVGAVLLSGYSAVAESIRVAPSFFSAQSEVPLGRTRVLPFKLSAPAPQDATLGVGQKGKDVLAVLGEPSVLQGHSVGYFRVSGTRPGTSTLRLGSSELRVIVEPGLDLAPADFRRPVIVAPAGGALLWGRFVAAVEILRDPRDPMDPRKAVRLVLPDGREVVPSSMSESGEGAYNLAMFDVSCDAFPAGPATLIARARAPDGWVLESAPIRVFLSRPIRPVAAGECRERRKPDDEEQRSFQDAKAISDAGASQKKCVVCPNSSTRWTVPFEAEQAGSYQVVLHVRGDRGAAALPTFGLFLDEYEEPVRVVRVPDHKWRSVAVGEPLILAKGEHVLSFGLLNAFQIEERANRALYLDRYEIVKVGLPGAVRASDEEGAVATLAPGMPFRVSVDQCVNGGKVAGPIQLDVACVWDRSVQPEPPRVNLHINDTVVAAQQSATPSFAVLPGALQPGANRVRVTAELRDGTSTACPNQTLFLEHEGTPCGIGQRFTALDERWTNPTTNEVGAGEAAILHLPQELRGDYALSVQGDWTDSGKKRRMVVDLQTDAGVREVSGDLKKGELVEVGLAQGSKALRLRVGGSGFQLEAVSLQPLYSAADREAPKVVVTYPSNKHVSWGADAVVVDVFDPRTAVQCDLLIDGKAQGLDVGTENGLGPVVLPWLSTRLTAGEHTVAVRVRDAAGNETVSDPITVDVLGEAPSVLTRHQRAVRLLNRFAYGVEPAELASILIHGEKAWLTDRLRRSFEAPEERAVLGHALTLFPLETAQDVERRAAHQLLHTANPARARFCWWLENHFSTWQRKTGAQPKWNEHLRYAQLGAGSFPDLLLSSATSPAMLVYLDQNLSFSGTLNENYAREIMELHTLGVDGGYVQNDVTELASLLTGWTVAEEGDSMNPGHRLVQGFRFDPSLNDGAARQVFGMAFLQADAPERFDRIRRALEMLAGHPATARFVCGKLAEHYMQMEPPEDVRRAMEQAFMSTGGDLKSVLLALASHDAFWDPALPSKFTTPLDFGVRLGRVGGDGDARRLTQFLQKSGMGMFGRPTPDGYPEAPAEYADTNGFLQRWNHASEHGPALGDLVPDVGSAEQKIDVAAMRMVGEALRPSSHQAAIQFMAAVSQDSKDTAGELAAFLACLPEMNLR